MTMPSWVDNYVSLPYSEVNCWGLVRLVYKEIFGVELADETGQRGLIKDGFWIDVMGEETYLPGDVLLFKSSAVMRHVGLVLDDRYMLHADKHCGTVIEMWQARVWLPRLRGIYRCKEIS